MIYTMENEQIIFSVQSIGAEPWNIIDKKTGYEYLWQGEKDVWNKWHAPILFPQCGTYKDGFIFNHSLYYVEHHGFARNMNFKMEQEGVFTIDSNAQTLKQFPFDFSLAITFTLEGRTITQKATVSNTGCNPMPFSLGFHPGYNVKNDTALLLDDQKIALDDSFFQAAKFYPLGDITKFGLTDLVSVETEGFSSVVSWSPENGKKRLMCLEPRTDSLCTGTGYPFTRVVNESKHADFTQRITLLEQF